MSNKRLLKSAGIVAIAGLLLSMAGLVGALFTTFRGVSVDRVSFDTSAYESPPHGVSGLLITPENPVSRPTPGVVFCHGVLLSKEAYYAQCRAVALKGLVVLAIDLRGHGATGGANDMGLSERWDVLAAADYLASLQGVDPERIAAAGHSLGGTSVTMAGFSQPDDTIKAVVSIGCQPGRRQALLHALGPFDDFAGKIWTFLAWSRRFDINKPTDLDARDIIGRLTTTRPPDFLMVLGDRDSTEPESSAVEMLRRATGVPDAEPGRTYGSFEDGTARRLVMTGDTHLSEAYSSEAWTALADWVFSSFGLERPGGAVRTGAIQRYLYQGLLMLGFLLLGLAVMLGVLSLRKRTVLGRDFSPGEDDRRTEVRPQATVLSRDFSPGEDDRRTEVRPQTVGEEDRRTEVRPQVVGEEDRRTEVRPQMVGGASRKRVALAVLAAILFGGISIAAFPLGKATGIRAFVPFLGADVYSSFVVPRTILLVPLALLLFALARTLGLKSEAFSGALWKPGALEWSATAGFVPFAVFTVLYAPAAYGLLMTRGIPISMGGFFTLAAVLLVQLWADQEFFHYFFMPAFGRLDTFLKRAGYVVVESAVRGAAFGLAFIPLMARLFYHPAAQKMPLVLTAGMAGFVLVLPVSALSLFARRRGYNVLAPCLALALFGALLLSCLVSVRAF